jgi:hypothetical protein
MIISACFSGISVSYRYVVQACLAVMRHAVAANDSYAPVIKFHESREDLHYFFACGAVFYVLVKEWNSFISKFTKMTQDGSLLLHVNVAERNPGARVFKI